MATKLKNLAQLIRSKNAGAFQLTFDIMFDDKAVYERVRDSKVLNKALIQTLYGTRPEDILLFTHDAAQAIKVTIPRPMSCGDVGDPDVFAGQQYAPLMDVEVP